CVVFGVRMAGGQQLLQQDRDFDPVRGAERIELQRVLSHRQRLLMRRAGNGTIDAGKRAAGRGVLPNLGRHIAGGEVLLGREFGRVGHWSPYSAACAGGTAFGYFLPFSMPSMLRSSSSSGQ